MPRRDRALDGHHDLSAHAWVAEPGRAPCGVYGIFVSLFILFNIFAVNQWLQYRLEHR